MGAAVQDRAGVFGPLDDATLHRRLGWDTVRRGAEYAAAGAVETVQVADAGRLLLAQVRGSGRRRYTTLVTATPHGWNGRCSCPMQVDCKHVAAVLLVVGDEVSAGPPPAAPAAWERAFTALAPVPVEADLSPLGLQLELVPAPRAAAARLRLRPVRPGSSGRWVRSGAGWRGVVDPYEMKQVQPAHAEAVRAVHAAWRSRQPAWVSSYSEPQVHLDDLGPSAWALLAAAQRAGVALLDERGQPTVRLAAEPARLVADLRSDGAHATLTTDLRVPGPEGAGPPVLVGRPAGGVFVSGPDGLLLAPLDPPLDDASSALLAASPVQLPAAELPRFFRRYYPGLRRRFEVLSSDDSVELPEIAPPRLALAVAFEPGHLTSLRWAFRYAVPGETVDVPLSGATAEVVRDPEAEAALLDTLAALPDVPGLWADAAGQRRPVAAARLSGVGTARFATDALPALLAHPSLDVEVAGEPAPYVESSEPPLITVATADSDSGPDWFDLSVEVSVDGERVPLAPLLSALSADEQHLVLDSGTWFSLDRPELHTLRRLLEEARALEDVERPGLRLSPFQAGLWEELVEIGVVAAQSEQWSRTVGGLLDLQELPRPEPPLKLQAELRPYQQDGYAWLSLLWDLGLGGVLADDMGLGKTLQTLAMATRAYEQGTLGGAAGPLLVVAPTSVVGTWVAEAERFCPDLPVVAVTETERRAGVPLAERATGAAVVVTSYALLRLDDTSYLRHRWSGLVLDEAQHVKNSRAKTYAVARRLPAPVKLAITGTPLENSLMDLWSMLSITAPGMFPDPQQFSDTWRRPIESGQAPELLAALRRRVRPLMLRRTKEQVAADLPPKVEQVVEVALSPAHRRIYDRHLARERQRVLGLLGDLQRNRFAVLKSLTLLRQLSLDPALVDDAHAGVGSAKIDALVESLRSVAEEGHRALVFSSFTGYLAQVRTRLDAEGIGYCYLDGRTRDRARRIEQFRTGDDPAFLISLKAGGTGLTLTEADYVFVLDPWWNPAVEAQAVDRAHRIGQTRTVMVYRLVSTDTVEQKVVALQQRKRDLFQAVIEGDGVTTGALTADDIRELLG